MNGPYYAKEDTIESLRERIMELNLQIERLNNHNLRLKAAIAICQQTMEQLK